MENLTDKEELIKPPQLGKIIEGKLVGKARSAVFLDLGRLGTGIIYGQEFQIAKNELRGLQPGDSVFAKITDLKNDDGYIELSMTQASSELTWDKLKEKKVNGEMLTVKILAANKGGLMAEVSGIPAFLPVSQLLSKNYPRVEKGDSTKILKELQKFVGQDMEVKIFDLDPRESKLIISEKAKESEKIREILKEYKLGDEVEGEITGVTDFGVFMKFGKEDLEGLIHISELDWQLIEDPGEIVKVGQKVKAKIISIIDEKVSLSLRALKKDPWIGIEETMKKGDVVEGKVTKLNPFGAFVELSPKIQGLCHISEFGTQKKLTESLEVGKKYKFQILQVSPQEHRMSLKLEEKK